MLDALIIFSLVSFIVQLVYANVIVRSRDPFNSYLAGVFCSLGQFALAGKYNYTFYSTPFKGKWYIILPFYSMVRGGKNDSGCEHHPPCGYTIVITFLYCLACLRVQLSDSAFQDYSNKKAIAEFILGSFLLYLCCLCLVG